MKNFDAIYEKVISGANSETKFVVKGKQVFPKGVVLLTTRNMPDNPYIKIAFDDGSFLLLMINDKEIYYADCLVGHIQSIQDEEIGNSRTLEYEGKTYELGNKDDYQYVIQRFLGGPKDIEGEARFSDYFPVAGPNEFLSLGWLSETGERADIHCKLIDPKEINIL